ncbi:MAG TPA: nicotinate (nicotinamide) nucleotide adenylyltransferase [Chitinophagaceae bacterium]|jgi:nicotinate-nucleotide adenylyltransferase|nr:nicotinate (nicotinamide) nucleotide adenylyltransferase [Chitinophagaceae bacterium]
MKIGLFFGSFNPVHIGHLIIASHILNETRLDKIWLVVSPVNPFKIDADLLNENARLSLVETALRSDHRIVASNIEFQLPTPSFTINTLSFLKENYSQDDFSIIMGSDNFRSFDKWKNYEEISGNYKILVYRRTGFEVENKFNANIEVLDAPLLDISSTEIRRLIREGKSIRYLVPETVRQEIEEKGYYKK